jgi:hypothetical protein
MIRPALASLLFVFFATGCTVTTTESGSAGGSDPAATDPPTPPDGPPAPTLATPGIGSPTSAVPANGVLPEVVYLFMTDKWRGGWMCTATLVAPDRIVTAAHCLDTTQFIAYEIVAPNAPGRPTVSATNPQVWGGSFTDVANPDLGFLTLMRPVSLPAYAELTDVVARVDAGEDVRAAAVVRTSEQAEAPLHVVGDLAVSSTVGYGYLRGLGTPMFSEGGDSGAGLFLVENGTITHKLIGVARQPDPARGLDHFTRVDSELLSFYGTAYPH